MAVYQVLYWKDIPAQIRVYDGKRPKGYEMPEWFQKEIDRVAMAEGLTGTDDYLDLGFLFRGLLAFVFCRCYYAPSYNSSIGWII